MRSDQFYAMLDRRAERQEYVEKNGPWCKKCKHLKMEAVMEPKVKNRLVYECGKNGRSLGSHTGKTSLTERMAGPVQPEWCEGKEE